MRDRPFEYTFGCFKGCLCILIAGVLSIVVVEHIGGCLSQMKQKNAALAAEQKRVKAEHEHELNKRNELRVFALREAPRLWESMLKVDAEISNQNFRVEKLRAAMSSFGRTPEEDDDFQRICATRDGLVKMSETMRLKLEDAYLASKKCEAMLDGADYKRLMQQCISDGINEAEKAEGYYNMIKQEKEKKLQ